MKVTQADKRFLKDFIVRRSGYTARQNDLRRQTDLAKPA
ncbi:unnamed protein product [Ciceribacter selenitireducens ATCC BAA-1503]|uniref:Uncharacterized protein n=1 Tax=Ciceribacter selenitireducens ATCC BAA-1503 TaxID=1336235 RepID=A0A376AF99_9HYPH|nr:unnamed protein product [Ciceribacter selenitireducens ATCC BAA-1503]